MAILTLNATVSSTIQSSNGTWPPTVGSGTGGSYLGARGFNGSVYYLYNRVFRFDTSSLTTAANISSAKLRVYVPSKSVADSGIGVAGEWYDPGATAGTEDWSGTLLQTAFATVANASITTGAYNEFTLLTPNTSISKTGFTGIRTHTDGSGAPTGNNLIDLDNSTNLPELVITYTMASSSGGLSGLSGLSAIF